jgi:hypothetical protein
MQLLKQLLLRPKPRKNGIHGRRAASTLPIGRMEQLEPRAMLSASYGGAHYAPHDLGIAAGVWESAFQTEQQVGAGGKIAADGLVANLVEASHNDGHIDAGRFDTPPQGLTLSWLPPPRVYYFIVTFHFSAPVTSTPNVGDIESQGFPSDPDVSRPPLMATSPSLSPPANSGVDSVADGVTAGPPPQSGWGQLNDRSSSNSVARAVKPTYGSAYNFADYSGLLAPTPATSLTDDHSTTESVRAHDTLFQDQTSLDLLLAADSNDSDDDHADNKVDSDRHRSPLDEEMDATDTLADSQWRDDVADSLGTLDRERAAIDEVLAQLHELEPFDFDRAAEESRTARHVERDYVEQFYAVETDQVPTAATNGQTSETELQGGMVLIQATGDANSSAYDLAAAVFNGEDGPTKMPIATEAAVGVYQAFDVGSATVQTTNGKSAPRGKSVAIGEQAAGEHQGGA